jgi:NagD protein
MTPRPRLRDWLEAERRSIDAVVLDIDGVLMRNRKALPGAVELLAMLRSELIPFALLTNDACHSAREKAGFLRAAGLEVDEGHLYSAGHALEDFVAERGLRGERFLALGRLGEPCYAESAGLAVCRDLAEIESTRGIILGETGYDWETAINAAINFLLRNPEALLVCPNPDVTFPTRDGGLRMASGAVAHLIQEMVERHGRKCAPVYLGKPFGPVYAACHARLERLRGGPPGSLEPARMLMVGDSLTGDIAGGLAFGCRTALVLTGLSTLELVEASDHRPEAVFSGL